MTSKAMRRLLLAWVGAAGCGFFESLAGAAVADAPDAKRPAVTLTLHEGSTTVFGGSELALHVDVQSVAPLAGNLVWRHTVENRTLSAGEVAVKPGEPLAFELGIPSVKAGEFIETQLTLSLVEAQANAKAPSATLVQTLWIVDRDPFTERKQWLADLKLSLYDPSGETAKVFEHAKIPFARVATLGALGQVTEGMVLIAEGIDLTRIRGIGESIFSLAARGIPVLCLAPAAGELPYPAVEGVAPITLRFDGDRAVNDLDKRLSAGAWPAGGLTPVHRFVPAVIHGELGLRVSVQPIGWPWIEARYPEKTKLILCGFPIIATWQQEATASYLLAGILQTLERPKETASE